MAGVSEVFAFFSENKTNSYSMGQFSKEWKLLNEQARNEIRRGIGDGSLTY